MDWSLQSPDLNLNKAMWGPVDREWKQRQLTSKEERIVQTLPFPFMFACLNKSLHLFPNYLANNNDLKTLAQHSKLKAVCFSTLSPSTLNRINTNRINN